MRKEIWMVIQKDNNDRYINLHSTAFTKEQDAIDEMISQNIYEISEYNWDYEVFFLKD